MGSVTLSEACLSVTLGGWQAESGGHEGAGTIDVVNGSFTVNWCTVVTVGIWTVAGTPLVWDLTADSAVMGRWGLYLSAAAVAWTVCCALKMHTLRLMAQIGRLRQEIQLDPPPAGGRRLSALEPEDPPRRIRG